MRRTAIRTRPMADTVLAGLEPEETEYRERDNADRLYFVVSPTGRKRWEVRFKREDSRWSWLGIGGYPDVSGKRARQIAKDVQGLVSDGIDPVQHRLEQHRQQVADEAPKVDEFKAVAEQWYQLKVNKGRAEKTLKSIGYAMQNDMIPHFHGIALVDIRPAACAALQAKIEGRGAFTTAEKVRVWMREIFDYAMVKGLMTSNPATALHVVALPGPEEQQYPHLLEHDLPAFLRALRASKSRFLVRACAWLTIMTASRPGMIRGARWSEIDFENALWHVPAERMKMRRAHSMPLPTQAVSILQELKGRTGRSLFVFPSAGPKNPVLSDASVNKCFALSGYKGRMTGHGARHTFMTLMSEVGWNFDWLDQHLAHKRPGLREVYDKSRYLEQRRTLIQWYADYLGSLESGMTDAERAAFLVRVNVV